MTTPTTPRLPALRYRATALVAVLGLTACVTNPTRPDAASAPAINPGVAAAPKADTGCERLSTMSNQQKRQTGAMIGTALGIFATAATGGSTTRHYATGALGGALIGALAGSAFKNEIDVEEQPDGTVKLKIPGSLMFASGQSALSPGFQSTLTRVTQTITRYCDISVLVVGHTDNIGAPAANKALSESRARSVSNHMGAQGFERARIRIEGRGADAPIASNADEQGRQENRRVEIFVRPPAT
jgi:outer membrane protein OmpA-like peptidoglycan-associated protein